ncbi:MAG: type II toxin-antitoxin system HicB family antitoxin [Clostridiales bacterium]|nr:type II toxin-antitoxin system HicB family antitoxin [Clostridiales bacterium]
MYPAIFEPNELGGYCVTFPDVQGAYTEGKTLAEAMENSQDALCLMLYNHEIRHCVIMQPTPIHDVKTPENSFVSLITCDTNFYKRYYADKVVKKTVTTSSQRII